MTLFFSLFTSGIFRGMIIGLLLVSAAWWLYAAGYAAGERAVRAEWAQAVNEARRMMDAAIQAAEVEKITLQEQLTKARKAAQRARGGVEKVDAAGAAALEEIR